MDNQDLRAIRDGVPHYEARLLAHILLAVRDYVIERKGAGVIKPIETWTAEDIIELAQSLS